MSMKNYYLILTKNFLGIGYLLLFLIGFFINDLNLYHIGGGGIFIFMVVMTISQSKKLFLFLFMASIGCIVAFFASKWWLGLFWVSSLYSAEQLFGVSPLLKNKKKLIEGISKKTTIRDNIELSEILFFIALIIAPYVFVNHIH